MHGFKQSRTAERIEEFPLVGIIPSELLPPRFEIQALLHGGLDLFESRPRISTDAPDLAIHCSNHRFYKLDLLLDKRFAFEHAPVAGNKRLEVQFHHLVQRS